MAKQVSPSVCVHVCVWVWLVSESGLSRCLWWLGVHFKGVRDILRDLFSARSAACNQAT